MEQPNRLGTLLRSIKGHLGFWICTLGALLLANAAISRNQGLILRPRGIELDPILLLFTVLGSAVAAILLLVSVWSRRGRLVARSGFGRGVEASFLLILPVCLTLASLKPGRSPLDSEREYVLGVPAKAQNRFGIVVLFENGSHHVRAAEARRLTEMLEILNRCNVKDMEVRGFASSAPYKGERFAYSDDLNWQLANRRAQVVAETLARAGISVRPAPWTTFADMTAERGIVDRNTQGKPILEKERLNRRAVVVWREDGNCGGAGHR